MNTRSNFDSPWSRLHWTLPAASLICALTLWSLAVFMARPVRRQSIPAPIDAQIIEQTVPVEMEKIKPRLAAAPPKSRPARLPAPPVKVTTKNPVLKEAPKPATALQQEKPISKPGAQPPLPPSPAVSLPKTNIPFDNKTSAGEALPSGNNASSGPVNPRAKTGAAAQSGAAGDSIAPQFGAGYLNNPKPVYPAVARRMGMEGAVMLKVFVSRTGAAIKIEILTSSGHKMLDEAAAQAVGSWRFIPARSGNTPIDAWVKVPIVFQLSK